MKIDLWVIIVIALAFTLGVFYDTLISNTQESKEPPLVSKLSMMCHTPEGYSTWMIDRVYLVNASKIIIRNGDVKETISLPKSICAISSIIEKEDSSR